MQMGRKEEEEVLRWWWRCRVEDARTGLGWVEGGVALLSVCHRTSVG